MVYFSKSDRWYFLTFGVFGMSEKVNLKHLRYASNKFLC
jgi:hypothetical protein